MIHQFHCKVREPKVCYRTIRSKHSNKAVSFRILVFERVGISLDEVYERVEKSVISVFKKACSKWLTDCILWLCKSAENVPVLWFNPILKTTKLQQLSENS